MDGRKSATFTVISPLLRKVSNIKKLESEEREAGVKLRHVNVREGILADD